jgi:hypothetical protein
MGSLLLFISESFVSQQQYRPSSPISMYISELVRVPHAYRTKAGTRNLRV